jgi:hypothetical protein
VAIDWPFEAIISRDLPRLDTLQGWHLSLSVNAISFTCVELVDFKFVELEASNIVRGLSRLKISEKFLEECFKLYIVSLQNTEIGVMPTSDRYWKKFQYRIIGNTLNCTSEEEVRLEYLSVEWRATYKRTLKKYEDVDWTNLVQCGDHRWPLV